MRSSRLTGFSLDFDGFFARLSRGEHLVEDLLLNEDDQLASAKSVDGLASQDGAQRAPLYWKISSFRTRSPP